MQRGVCRILYGETKQPLHKCRAQHRRARGWECACVDREDRCFDREVKEASLNRGGGLRHQLSLLRKRDHSSHFGSCETGDSHEKFRTQEVSWTRSKIFSRDHRRSSFLHLRHQDSKLRTWVHLEKRCWKIIDLKCHLSWKDKFVSFFNTRKQNTNSPTINLYTIFKHPPQKNNNL